MPIHSLASVFGDLTSSQLVYGAAAFGSLYGVKLWAGGKKCTWERDWAGKMILIVAPPTPTILTLIDHLLRLPSPPQILFLPPIPSPLPDELLTILHTIRLTSTAKNPLAQLHCEPLPRTALAIKGFTQKWSTAPQGTVGEVGRRIDAIVLGSGWEVQPTPDISSTPSSEGQGQGQDGQRWTIHQFHFHLITSLLPHLLRFPLERNVRIISLVAPTWSAAIPSLTGVQARDDLVQHTGRKSINTLLLMQHFQWVLDTLASATMSKVRSNTTSVPVPIPGQGEDDTAEIKQSSKIEEKREKKRVRSNIMAVSVIMGWARQEVVKSVVSTTLGYLFYILLYPLLWLITPSSSQMIQPILFALQAPVRAGLAPVDDTPKIADVDAGKLVDVRREAVGGGDTVRDCAVVDIPPVLRDPALAKAVYEELEKEVEKGVKQQEDKSKGKKSK